MDFPVVANATAETGKPIYYRGEKNPDLSGLYHPPAYIYLLAAWFRVFGFGEAQVRVFGLLCALLQGLLVLAILRVLFGPAARSKLAPWFWAVFLLNPYTLQTAAIADIDSTIYGPLLGLILLAALRLSWRDGRWREDQPSKLEYVLLAVAIMTSLWAKMTTVCLVIPFVFFFLISRFGYWRAARISGFATVAGVGGFLLTYLVYGGLLNLDVGRTFAFTFNALATRGTSGHGGLAARLSDYFNNLQAMIPFMLCWTGLVPWILLGTGVVVTAYEGFRRRDRRARHYFLLLLLAAGSTLYYCAQQRTFGFAPSKYTFVFWGLSLTPMLLLALGYPRNSLAPHNSGHADEPASPLPPALAPVCVALVLAFAWCGRYIIRDSAILQYVSLERAPVSVILAPALIVFASVLWYLMGSKRVLPYARAALIAGICVHCGLQLGTAVYQAQAPYSTTYDYGQSGLEEAAAFVHLNTSPEQLVASMKDLGFHARRRYYETYQLIYGGPEGAQKLIDLIASGKVKFAVFTEGAGQDQVFVNPPLKQWIDSHCVVVAAFGNYRIYKTNEL